MEGICLGWRRAVVWTAAWACAAAAGAGEPAGTQPAGVRHRFLAVDESRGQLVYTDQFEPKNDWSIKLPGRCRDYQLIGGDAILLSTPDGFAEYSLVTKELVRQVKGYRGAVAARRMPDGRTVLACNQQGVTVYEVGADGKVGRKANFKTPQTRLVRLTAEGTLLFGANDRIVEGDLDGKTIRSAAIPAGKHVYQALRRADGHVLVATGYGGSVVELDGQGKVVRTLGGRDAPGAKEHNFNFFAGFQVLRNGHVVVSNWTGHGAGDSSKGTQIVEFDKDGLVVWSWHDAKRAGTIHGVIVLDELDTKVLHDDVSGVLGPVK